MPILPWFFAFLFSGFFIPWRSRRPYSSGFTVARTRDRLCKIYGWSVALAAGYLSYRGLSDSLASLFNGGALESIVTPCAFFTALAVALLTGVLLHSLPNRLHDARLAGRLAAESARETLTLTGGWLAVILLLACYQSLIVRPLSLPGLAVSPENLCRLLLASFAGTAAFALIRLWLTPVAPLTIRLHWPTTGQPMLSQIRETSIAPTYWLVFDRPLRRKTDGQLIDRLALAWNDAPLVLIAPPGGDLFGEHLHLADRQGHLKALFPRLEIELDDWKRLLPPAECWPALEYRELYPSDRLLPVAVKTLQGAQDKVILVNDANLERWRGLLADVSTCVLVFDVDSNEISERIAGYRTLTVRGNKIPKFDFEVTEVTKLSYRPAVFISYVNIYRDYAQRLTHALQQDCEVLSDLQLQAGDRGIRKLADMLESADTVIALAGDATAKSFWAMAGTQWAIKNDVPLIPVFVNRFTKPRELLERFCANTDAAGKIVYLSDCRGKELDRAIALTAGNIVKAIARIQTTNSVETVIHPDDPSRLGERVQIVLARQLGFSRREAECWIVADRVKVNGNSVRLGARLKNGDQLQVDDRIVDWKAAGKQDTRVLLYHKPIGELVTHRDPENRPVIFNNLPKLEKGQWFAAMRLDINTSGIVLVTNDGKLGNRLMQSATEIEHEYAVRVLGEISDATLEVLKQGVELEDGKAWFDEINFVGGEGASKWYRVTINRVRKRLLESQQIQVSRLILVRYGPIKLPDSLKIQDYCELPDEELDLLLQCVKKPG